MNKIFAWITVFLFGLSTGALAQGWQWQNPLPQGNFVNSLNALDANHVWFGTRAGVVVHTSDGGQSWQLQQTPSEAWISGIDFIDYEYGWAVGDEPSLGENPVILHTKDGGNTWSRVSWPPGLSQYYSLKGVQFVDRKRGWVIGTEGLLLFTDDGGETWEEQSENVLPNRAGILEDISIVDSSEVWVVGHRAILHTQDAGQTWHRDTTEFVSANVFEEVQFVDRNHGWLLEWPQSGNLYKTINGGKDWQQVLGPRESGISHVYFLNPDSGWIHNSDGVHWTENGGETWEYIFDGAAGDFIFLNASVVWSSFIRTVDGGRTWQKFKSSVTGQALWAVDFIDTRHGWAVGSGGTIIATRDGGQTWEQQNSGVGNRLVEVQFMNRNLGWVVGFTDLVLRTSDGGEIWQGFDTYPPQPENRAVCFVDSLHGWIVGDDVGDPGWIRYSDDSGITWQDQTPGVIPSLNDVFFVDSLKGWVIGDEGYLAQTQDGGTTWDQEVTNTGSRLGKIYFIAGKDGWILYSADDFLVTSDGGEHWQKMVSEGLPEGLWGMVFVNMQQGWISASSGGIYSTDDGGQTWERQFSGTDQTLWSIDFVGANHGWATSNFGIILYTSSGGVTSVVEPNREVPPLSFQLYQNYPNPFNPATLIKYQLSTPCAVTLKIYNLRGREIRTLIDEVQSDEVYEVRWDGKNNLGESVSSGIYVYRLQAGERVAVRKLTLLK